MKIAIITSGGDSSGMNPAIKSFVERCLTTGAVPFGVFDGLEGLIDGAIEPLGASSVAGIIHRGGTILRSSRSERFLSLEGRDAAARQLAKHGIGHVVMLGGDGSYRAMRSFHEDTGIAVACVPATIDNDVAGSDYSLGVDTALNVIRGAIDSIRDTAASFRRAFVIETMGRNSGFLAIVSAVTSGAEICLVPELEFDADGVRQRLLSEIRIGRRYVLAVVSEGVEGGTAQVEKLLGEEVGLECRSTVLGHVQRGGAPTVYDRRMAAELVTTAIGALADGLRQSTVACRGSEILVKPLAAELLAKVPIDETLLALASRLAR